MLLRPNIFCQFNANVWTLMLVEFFERLAYYGCAFSLTMYSLNMLNMSVSDSNLVINGLYAVSPIGALLGANLADGMMSRKKILLFAGIVYTCGLGLMAYSSMPAMYNDFPLEPTKTSIVIFCCSIVLFGFGYGSLKVVISPLVGDCVVAQHGEASAALLSTLYRLDYWVYNFGSLIGIMCLPMMRGMDHRKKEIPGSDDIETGFYYSFWASAVSTGIGVIFCMIGYLRFPTNSTCCTSHIYLVFLKAVSTKIRFLFGCEKDEQFEKTHKGKLLEYAAYKVDDTSATGQEILKMIEPMRTAFKACKVLAPLPIYWLIGGQFSSNVVLQASWLDIPDWIQPEAYNNISTLALLSFMPIFETCIIPKVWPFRRPPVIPRMLIGFGLVAVSMLYCGVLQLFISQRGTFTEQGDFILNKGESKLSGLWMIGPFVLQGIAGVFVDTTSLEAAYTIAAPCMKSLVVAIYLMASACAGFLGMAFAPFVTANTFVIFFFVLALLQGIVMWLFSYLAGSEIDALVDPHEERLIADTLVDEPPVDDNFSASV